MRIALLSPLPPEQTGIADYAAVWRRALEEQGVSVAAPLSGQPPAASALELGWQLQRVDWSRFELAHAELGGGREREFMALEWLARHQPWLKLTATVHDPERLIWRPPGLPRQWPRWLSQGAALLTDPLTLARERRLAGRLARLVTLTDTGADCLARRMRSLAERVARIPHGNQALPAAPLPPLPPEGPLRLLYFGFIYRGKGIEDLLDALALLQEEPDTRDRVRLTLAGGAAPDIAFGRSGSYLDSLRQRAIRLGLRRNMLDWRLNLPAEQIPALIQAHHTMVLPYRESRKLAWLGQMRGTSGALSWPPPAAAAWSVPMRAPLPKKPPTAMAKSIRRATAPRWPGRCAACCWSRSGWRGTAPAPANWARNAPGPAWPRGSVACSRRC